jgi:hypothetical protein
LAVFSKEAPEIRKLGGIAVKKSASDSVTVGSVFIEGLLLLYQPGDGGAGCEAARAENASNTTQKRRKRVRPTTGLPIPTSFYGLKVTVLSGARWKWSPAHTAYGDTLHSARPREERELELEA